MTFDLAATEKLLATVRIPPVPEVLQRLRQVLQKPDPSPREIAQVVMQDMGMAALVLRTVNSSFFGLRNKANSIQHAALLLGVNNTAQIVTSLALRRSMGQLRGVPPHFWDSPVNIAKVSAEVARRISKVSIEEAYMLGLFHNSGHAVLMEKFPDYAIFLRSALNHPDTSVSVLEDARYNTHHAVVSFLLARNWGVDKNVAQAILQHHNTLEVLGASLNHDLRGVEMRLIILKIAEHVDKRYWGTRVDYEWERIKHPLLEHLGMSEPDFADLRADMLERLTAGD